MHTVPRVCSSQWWELVRVFLTLGALSPSGPGLMGVLQTEVQEKRDAARRWANYVSKDEKVETTWQYLLVSETDVATAKGS